jgi:hypothetical protein
MTCRLDKNFNILYVRNFRNADKILDKGLLKWSENVEMYYPTLIMIIGFK